MSALLAGPAAAQAQDGDGGGMEEFPEVDPYTEGDPEAIARLGYVRLGGGFVWLDGRSTEQVRTDLGDPPMLWVETEHFLIGSTLGTYEWSGDQEEKDKLEDELERLEERLGRARFPRRELDPWLQLHLYALRAEEAYAAFLDDFDLDPAAWADEGPVLGRPDKLRLLLCRRDSELGRHTRVFWNTDAQFGFHWTPWEGPYGLALSFESYARSWADVDHPPLDAILHCQVAYGLAALFVEGYRDNRGGRPYWLVNAYAHLAGRRADPRYLPKLGLRPGQRLDGDDHEWEPRVKGLVEADYFASTREVLGWSAYEELDVRDHMTAWSRLEYLLEERGGDRAAFLDAVCAPVPEGEQDGVAAELVDRQLVALRECFDLDAESFDERWARWVRREYASR